MSIKDRKERQKAEMRRVILHTAMELFLSHGFDQVSIRKIAEHLEYSSATIYLYFRDKDEILTALHDEGFDKLYKVQSALGSGGDPFNLLMRHAKVYITFALANPEYYDLMFIQRSPMRHVVSPDGKYTGLRSYDLFRGHVQGCLDAGRIKPGDPDTVSLALWAQVHGIASLVIRDRLQMLPRKKIKAYAFDAVKYLLEGLEAKA
jgi:AcrR family transcriptional regulator